MAIKKLKTTDQLLKALHAAKSDHARTLIAHAMDVTRNHEAIRMTLGGQLEYIRRLVERAQQELKEEGRTPNSLGILQGNGPDADRLCGELARTREAAAAAQELLVTLGINREGYIDLTDAENARHEAWAKDEPGAADPDGPHGEGNCTM